MVITSSIALRTRRRCLREPIPEIAEAARLLEAAVLAHRLGEREQVERLLRMADMPAIKEWTNSLWGKSSPYVQYRGTPSDEPFLPPIERQRARMPTAVERRQLHERDGYHCTFCGIPVMRREIRQWFVAAYPSFALWARKTDRQHAAFQAMWAQYDHLLPHARGGRNDLENIVVTCAPCNYGRMSYTLEEVNLSDPRTREPVRSSWDGLERVLVPSNMSLDK